MRGGGGRGRGRGRESRAAVSGAGCRVLGLGVLGGCQDTLADLASSEAEVSSVCLVLMRFCFAKPSKDPGALAEELLVLCWAAGVFGSSFGGHRP